MNNSQMVPIFDQNSSLTKPSKMVTNNSTHGTKYNFKCEKCGCTEYKTGETISVGGLISKILNIQTRRFSTLTCQTCGFTEFFERYQNPITNIIDIFIR
eukprot:gene10470-2992_t